MGKRWLAAAIAIVSVGCGAFLNLGSDDDDAPPNVIGPNADGSTDDSSPGSSGGIGEPDAEPGDGVDEPIPKDAAADPDAQVGNFKKRTATFEGTPSPQLVGAPNGMDGQKDMQPLTASPIGDKASAQSTNVNDSRIWFDVATDGQKDVVEFSFSMRVETLPQMRAVVMRLGDAMNGLTLEIDGAGIPHFSMTGNPTGYSPPITKLGKGTVVKVWVRMDQAGARMAMTDGRTPASLGLLTWPAPLPILTATVGRVGGAQSGFTFDDVMLGPKGAILPK